MAEYLSPGVYIEEFDNSPRPMEGVGTSTAGFVGMARRGSTSGAPVLVTNFGDFVRKYGNYLSETTHGEYRYLANSVEQFFMNGGTRCYISRVVPENAAAAQAQAGILHISAADEGSYGNQIVLRVNPTAKKKFQLLEKISDLEYKAKSTAGLEAGSIVVIDGEYNRIESISDRQITFARPFSRDVVDTGLVPEKVLCMAEMQISVQYNEEVEVYEDVNLNPPSPNYIAARLEKSALIKIKAGLFTEIREPSEAIAGAEEVVLAGGSDGTLNRVTAATFTGKDNGPGRRTGIQAFLENTTVSILAVPGITMPEVIDSLIAHCENTKRCFAVIDMPAELSGVKELTEFRERIDSTYAAMYHPWIQQFDRLSKKNAYFPPSGAVMGVYARTDVGRGVHKAPANETVACTGLSVQFSKVEQDSLNPIGVNLIRNIPGSGIRIWGARTASNNSAFKYVNIRRLLIYVEESIKANTNWVVFEPNDQMLWERVSKSISLFLTQMWRNGMLAGGSEAESYFVDLGPSTMSPDDIRNGRLICNVGVAPVRPAEFIIFRVTQHTVEAGE